MKTNIAGSSDSLVLISIALVLIIAIRGGGSVNVSVLEILIGIFILGGTTWALLRLILVSDHWSVTTKSPHWSMYLIIFTIWALLNVVTAILNDVTVINWGRRVAPILMLPLTGLIGVATFRTRKGVHLVYVLILMAGVLTIIDTLISVFVINLSSVKSLQTLRQFGGGFYSAFGFSLVVAFIYRFRKFNLIQRFLFIGAVAVFGASLVLTFTRTYWVSVTIAVSTTAVIAIKKRRESPNHLWFITPAVVVVGISLVLVAPERLIVFILERLASFTEALSTLSVRDRLMEIRGIIQSSQGDPLGIFIGHGLGSEYTFYSISPFSWSGKGILTIEYSHNYYAYLYWTTGLIGLTLYILFWIQYLRELVATICNNDTSDTIYLLAMLSATVNVIVASLTAPPFMNLTWTVYFGLLMGASYNMMEMINEDD